MRTPLASTKPSWMGKTPGPAAFPVADCACAGRARRTKRERVETISFFMVRSYVQAAGDNPSDEPGAVRLLLCRATRRGRDSPFRRLHRSLDPGARARRRLRAHLAVDRPR